MLNRCTGAPYHFYLSRSSSVDLRLGSLQVMHMGQHIIPFEKSEDDARPIYYQLAKTIQDHIESGRLAAGEKIQSEREFAALYDLSLATVRKALDSLVHQGLLSRIQGKGTFVSSTANRREKLRYYPFVKDFQDDALIARVQFVDLNRMKGHERINRHLKVKSGDELYKMRRVLQYQTQPLVYSVSYLPCRMFKNLSEYDQHLFEKYLYLFLEDEFGVSTIENEELYGVTVADKETASHLGVKPNHPLLKVDMIAYTHKKKPYEYRESYCVTDEMKIRRFIGSSG